MINCPNCNSSKVETTVCPDKFLVGDSIYLAAMVPFRKCLDCGFAYTDSEAEVVRHEAVCKHFGRYTPAEIKAVRESRGLGIAEFCEYTGLDPVYVERWESGESLQPKYIDRYYCLLRFNDSIHRLRRKHEREDW